MLPLAPNIWSSVVHGSGRGICSSALALAVRQAVAVGMGLLGVSSATEPVAIMLPACLIVCLFVAYFCSTWPACAGWPALLGWVQGRGVCGLEARNLGWPALPVRHLERSWRLPLRFALVMMQAGVQWPHLAFVDLLMHGQPATCWPTVAGLVVVWQHALVYWWA